MKQEIIKEIVNVLNKNFKGKTVNIIFNGSLETVVKINNFRYCITRDTIIFSNGKQEKLKIDTFWLDNTVIKNNSIRFYMDSDFTIVLDI